MDAADIIQKYQLYTDDQSSVSSDDELGLVNKMYHRVLDNRPWWFLIKNSTALSTSTSVPYVAVPADFKYFTPNYCDWETDELSTVIFLGTNRTPYKVIPFNERNKYYNSDGYCYYDGVNDRICFTKQPTSVQVMNFDYVYQPDDLALDDEPLFPARYHDILYHAMCADFDLIQQTEKGMSYRGDNLSEYNKFLESMAIEDARKKINY